MFVLSLAWDFSFFVPLCVVNYLFASVPLTVLWRNIIVSCKIYLFFTNIISTYTINMPYNSLKIQYLYQLNIFCLTHNFKIYNITIVWYALFRFLYVPLRWMCYSLEWFERNKKKFNFLSDQKYANLHRFNSENYLNISNKMRQSNWLCI